MLFSCHRYAYICHNIAKEPAAAFAEYFFLWKPTQEFECGSRRGHNNEFVLIKLQSSDMKSIYIKVVVYVNQSVIMQIQETYGHDAVGKISFWELILREVFPKLFWREWTTVEPVIKDDVLIHTLEETKIVLNKALLSWDEIR